MGGERDGMFSNYLKFKPFFTLQSNVLKKTKDFINFSIIFFWYEMQVTKGGMIAANM
jgi:hypothetical protein